MIEKLIRWLINEPIYDWFVVESNSAIWDMTHGKLREQRLAVFNVMYSRHRDYYELFCEGYNPTEHILYGKMLQRTSDLNTGIAIQDIMYNFTSQQVEGKLVAIKKYPLKNKKESILSLLNEDKRLKEVLEGFKKELVEGDIEIFEEFNNILITSEGYFVANFDNETYENGKNTGEN